MAADLSPEADALLRRILADDEHMGPVVDDTGTWSELYRAGYLDVDINESGVEVYHLAANARAT